MRVVTVCFGSVRSRFVRKWRARPLRGVTAPPSEEEEEEDEEEEEEEEEIVPTAAVSD